MYLCTMFSGAGRGARGKGRGRGRGVRGRDGPRPADADSGKVLRGEVFTHIHLIQYVFE